MPAGIIYMGSDYIYNKEKCDDKKLRLREALRKLESEIKKTESESVLEAKFDFISNFLTASSFLVGIISVLFTIFFFVAINIATNKYKELKTNYDELKNSLEEAGAEVELK